MTRRTICVLLGLALTSCQPWVERPVVVGSKKFTESVILAEFGQQLIQFENIPTRRDDLGGTPALWLALTQGDIDAYPEYTGTITRQILRREAADLEAALAPFGVKISRSLGFRNNYALGMTKANASKLGLRTISDLRRLPALRCGFIPEFLDRPDGWPGLKRHYQLPQTNIQAMNHTLAYRALVEGGIDVMELYTTDGEIAQYDLLVLEDDLGFFPAYEAVWLYRADLEQRHPRAISALQKLESQLSEATMQDLNSRVQQKLVDEPTAVREFLKTRLQIDSKIHQDTRWSRVRQTTGQHLALVIPSLLAAVLCGVPLGVAAAYRARLGSVLLGLAGILQTIPSLALLLFMIPVMMWLVGQGTGPPPAIAALFLYSLLPIIRNTQTGLISIPRNLIDSATALGLTPGAILWRVELPLASASILAGVRTAAVINVGSATLGGFIGAGGYGAPILRGLDKFDIPLMLEGAIPAAVMALALDAGFGLTQKLLPMSK